VRCTFAELDGRIACTVCGREVRRLSTVAAHLPSRGVGDTVAKLAAAVGVKPCAKCNKRKERLNRAMPY